MAIKLLFLLPKAKLARGAGRYGKLVVLVYIELAKNIGGAITVYFN